MHVRLLLWLVPIFMLAVFLFPTAYAADNPVKIRVFSSFVDSEGKQNVIGLVRNSGNVPVQVELGLDVQNTEGNKETLQESTYGRIIYPLTESPFKFKVENGMSASDPFIVNVQETPVSFYDVLVLNYSNMAVGESKALVGTVKNIGPFDVYDVSVYASVHDENTAQIDSVRSNIISVIKPGEEKAFTALPDQSLKSAVYYYSCAGLDLRDPITTLKVGEGQFLAYNLRSVAQVSGLKYENTTDSVMFAIKHYNPNGGPATLRLPQVSTNQTIVVMMDGSLYQDATTTMDGKTVQIDFFVPKGDHKVQIQGVRNVPEFPFAFVGLAAVIAFVIFLARLKGFKMS